VSIVRGIESGSCTFYYHPFLFFFEKNLLKLDSGNGKNCKIEIKIVKADVTTFCQPAVTSSCFEVKGVTFDVM
jgi:hypothetical protein